MKYTICVRRPTEGDFSNEIVEMSRTLLKGGIVHWGKAGKVIGFAEPLHENESPAIEPGYINMLVEAPFVDYLGDKIKFSEFATIKKGWPKLIPGAAKRYSRV